MHANYLEHLDESGFKLYAAGRWLLGDFNCKILELVRFFNDARKKDQSRGSGE